MGQPELFCGSWSQKSPVPAATSTTEGCGGARSPPEQAKSCAILLIATTQSRCAIATQPSSRPPEATPRLVAIFRDHLLAELDDPRIQA
jgi:hypothetical protein